MDARALSREFNAEGYRAAAMEHVPVAVELYDQGRYVLANYVAGLAVECIFRAYRYKFAPRFDARHDLRKLFKQSRFADAFPQGRDTEYSAHWGTVVAQWENRHRFRSEKALRSYLKDAKLDRTVSKGDYLKELTRRLVHASTELVTLGAGQWQRRA